MPSGKECVRVEQGLQKCEGLSVIAACRARIEAANFALGSIQASSRTGALEARACYREQRASHAFLLHPPLLVSCGVTVPDFGAVFWGAPCRGAPMGPWEALHCHLLDDFQGSRGLKLKARERSLSPKVVFFCFGETAKVQWYREREKASPLLSRGDRDLGRDISTTCQ